MRHRILSQWKIAAAWAVGVLYFTSQDFLALPSMRAKWGHLLFLNALQITVWALLVLPALAFLRRKPLQGPAFWRRLAVFAPMTLTLVSLGIVGAFLLARLDLGWSQALASLSWAALGRYFSIYFHFYFLTYLSVLFAYHAHVWRQQAQAQELLASRLESQLVQAQNQALRMQLQPHFLFNTLHSISSLMHSDPAAADRMVTHLGDLLRLSLDRSGAQEISLDEELAFLRAYLEIERSRFKERLAVRYEVPEPLLGAQVPTFILQPLVENALKHGLSRRKEGGRVAIRATAEAGALRLEVEDDGVGPAASHGEGVGLRSVRERLALLYGAASRFSVGPGAAGGCLASLTLPLRGAAGEAAP